MELFLVYILLFFFFYYHRKRLDSHFTHGIIIWMSQIDYHICHIRIAKQGLADARMICDDLWEVDNLVILLSDTLGNHERSFLNVAEEWLCHDTSSKS